MPDQETIQGTLLEVCVKNPSYKEVHSLFEVVAGEFPDEDRPSELAMNEAFWRVVALGLAFPEFQGLSPILMRVTAKGQAAAAETLFNPDFPPRYLERLKAKVPNLGDAVERCVREALQAYEVEAFLASAVMLGVASEGATLELADSFAEWLAGKGQDALKNVLAQGKSNYVTVLEEVRKRLDPHLENLPPDLRDGLDSKMALADLFRGYRNDAGHPTGKVPSREECFESLVLFPAYAEWAYGLNKFFRS